MFLWYKCIIENRHIIMDDKKKIGNMKIIILLIMCIIYTFYKLNLWNARISNIPIY